MEVLKDNYNKKNKVKEELYPKTCVCCGCDSELEYDKKDIHMGAFGCPIITCPLCCEEIILDDEEGLKLTIDNVEFPTHFEHTSKENGAKDYCNNKNIKENIRRAINYLRNNKEEFEWFYMCGNLYLSVRKYDGDEEYNVIASNNFYETYIPFELEDYEAYN